jgi:hypothetical protein
MRAAHPRPIINIELKFTLQIYLTLIRIKMQKDLRTPRMPNHPPPMTSATCALSVRGLNVLCLNCRHQVRLDADGYPEDMPVPWFGPRMFARAAVSSTPTRG